MTRSEIPLHHHTAFAASSGWVRHRAALLGTVAAGALFAASPAAAGPQPCVVGPVANIVVCQGNQSAGIKEGVDFVAPPFTTLLVNTLTADIAPTLNTNGIDFSPAIGPPVGPSLINIISNTGSFSIIASGSGNGIRAISNSDASVTVDHTGNIRTADGNAIVARSEVNGGSTSAAAVSVTMRGDSSGANGVIATSSVFGGTGNAGSASISFTGNINAADTGIIAASSILFGNGTTAAATVTSVGNITAVLNGIRAQSSNDGTGNAGTATVTSTGDIAASTAILATSTTSSNGNIGAVTVTSIGNLIASTFGIRALSSVNGSIGDAGAITVTSTGNITPRGGGSSVGARISAISTAGQDGGNSDSVTVTSTGNLIGNSEGIIAESRAQSGSAGGVTVQSAGDLATGRIGISAGSLAGGGGNAGAVTVTSTGNINARETGISVGSSARDNGNAGVVTVTNSGNLIGGIQGINAESFFIGNGTGNAGPVSVTSTGTINVSTGGIRALSFVVGTGNAGDVAVNVAGNVTANDTAIEARSFVSAGTAGNVRVSLTDGIVTGGVRGVAFKGGAANLLTVSPTATLLSQGTAISGGGNATIDNFGTVTGNVRLDNGNNLFNNHSGSLFHPGPIANLRATGVLTNAGTLAPGGAGTAPITTALTGNLVQTASGTYAVDVTSAGADRINVSGTANLAGSVLPTVTPLTSARQQFTILSAANGVTDNGISVRDTAALDFELLFPNANDMVLSVAANFIGAAQTPNQRVTAAHLQSALNAGGGGLGGLLDHLVSIADVNAFAAALDRLHPEPYLALTQSVLLANLGFTDSLLSCPTAASVDTNAFLAEGQCVWARAGGRALDVNRTTENLGFADRAFGGSAGVQFAVAPNWFGSVALGYDHSEIKVDNRASARGDLFYIGGGAKYLSGNWQLSGAVAGGHANYSITRSALISGVDAKANAPLSFISGRIRAAYVFGSDTAYIKPLVDLDATGIRRSKIQESTRNTAPIGLNVRGQTDTLFSVAPALEIGGQYVYGDGNLLRPFLRAGVRWLGESNLKATASFTGSPTEVPDFTVTMPIDRWMGEVSTGVELLRHDRYDARVSYEGRFGERATQHGGNLKLRAKF